VTGRVTEASTAVGLHHSSNAPRLAKQVGGFQPQPLETVESQSTPVQSCPLKPSHRWDAEGQHRGNTAGCRRVSEPRAGHLPE
jgi:hypothetical protein